MTQTDYRFKPGALMGRLANGAARDAGTLTHLVPESFAQYQSTGKALCGAKPGRSSGGWDVEHVAAASCIRCISKQQKLASAASEVSVADAIASPDFSHARAGDGCWRTVVWIYHRDHKSPSGVSLVASGDKSIVEPLLRNRRNASPLSPDEPR